MKRFLIRILASAAAFDFIFPMIPGIDFHGNFGGAIVAALVFGLIGALVDWCVNLISTILAITTLGLALLVIIPLRFFGFWLLPAIALHLCADLMPHHLAVAGWFPAIEGGFVLLVIGMLTSSKSK